VGKRCVTHLLERSEYGFISKKGSVDLNGVRTLGCLNAKSSFLKASYPHICQEMLGGSWVKPVRSLSRMADVMI
jgi:hypothetical protein